MGAPRRLRRPTLETVLTLLAVAGAALFVFWQLSPSLLFRDTLPAGGDMGAHVWGPAYLRDHLLPHGRLSGWTPDWYAGFPAYQFYMVVPSLFIVALDVVLPYAVAFKLVTVAGVLSLPIAAWAFGRMNRLPFPAPALLAVATVPYLFDRSFTIYGGNVASTLAGEFAFSISLTFAVLFLGVVLRGLDTGRHRALAAFLLGMCAVCHLIPAIFALVGAGVALALRGGWARVRWTAPVVVVGGLLTSFWTVPFVLRHSYLNDMGWQKLTSYWEYLFPGRIGESVTRALGGKATAAVPGDMTWIVVLALVGAAISLAYRRRVGNYLTVLALVLAVGFLVAPQGRLWNARLLPFWYLVLHLLAALAVTEVIGAIAALLARDPAAPDRRIVVAGLVAAIAAVLVVVGLPLRALPGGTVAADGLTYKWLGFHTTDHSFIPYWDQWNYQGYEGKKAWPEYKQVVGTMAGVGKTYGCGRAMWEYEPNLDRYGTPMALMLLPYFTDGCIGSMEGLYFEASATTPYHFLNQSELSAQPSRAQSNLPYGPLDVAKGVRHLQLLGVRYYMATSTAAIGQADAVPDLTPITTVGPWHVYEVAHSQLVQPLAHVPAVLTGVAKGGRSWLNPSAAWYEGNDHSVFLAASGPSSWPRVKVGQHPTTAAVAPVKVTHIRSDDQSISFDVDRPGTPVLVKTSYFPNWQASGASGPWRVTPNLMVVVPTGRHVRLHYGTTGVDELAWVLTLAGIALLWLLARRGPVAMPEPPAPPPADDDDLADEFDAIVERFQLTSAAQDTDPAP